MRKTGSLHKSTVGRLLYRQLLLILLALFALGYPAIAGARQVDEPTTTPVPTPVALEGAPVVVNGQELFRLQARAGSITAPERADIVSEHISQLANNPFTSEVTVTVVDSQGATDIVVGEEVLVTVSAADAIATGRDRQELAQEWATAIQTAITEGQESLSATAVTARLSITLSVLLAVVALIWLVNRFGNWLVNKLDPATDSGRLPPALARSEFYQSGVFSRMVRMLMRVFKFGLAIFLITVAVPLILRAFPRTESLGRQIGRVVLTPFARLWNGFVAFLPDLVFLLILGVITWLVSRSVRLFFHEVERGTIRIPSFESEWAPFTSRMINALLVIAAFIIGFTSLPISQLPVFQGISAFVALLLTLASSSAIANIIAGIILTYTGSFRLGDYVSIQSTTGEVVGKYLLTTRVRTYKNEVVSFPNSLVLNNSVTNFSRLARENGLTLHTTITIGYDVPWQQVHELLIAAARDGEDILENPPPFVLQTALNDYNVAYELNAFIRKPEKMPALYSALHRHIQDRFNAAGVEIMSPAFTALRDGSARAMPPEAGTNGTNGTTADGRPPTDPLTH